MQDSSRKRQAPSSPDEKRPSKVTRAPDEQSPDDIDRAIAGDLELSGPIPQQSASFHDLEYRFLLAAAVSSTLFHWKIQGVQHLPFKIIQNEAYLDTIAACIKTGKFSKILEFPEVQEAIRKAEEEKIRKAKEERMRKAEEEKKRREANNSDRGEDAGDLSATIKSWKEEYRGSAASCLYQVMSRYMSPDFLKQLGEPGDLEIYAFLLPIVQSSGTGKSRMVDEVSKKHIVIPVNLKEDEQTGFPPVDKGARDYLVNPDDATARYHAYLTALFETAADVIRHIKDTLKLGNDVEERDLERIALKFREYMSVDHLASLSGKPEYVQTRESFYDRVVTKAKQLLAGVPEPLPEMNLISKGKAPEIGMVVSPDIGASVSKVDASGNDVPLAKEDAPSNEVTMSGEHDSDTPQTPPPTKTKTFISPSRVVTFNDQGKAYSLEDAASALINLVKPKHYTPEHGPLITLSFDEAHLLATKDGSEHRPMFFSLRRALRALRKHSIFTLFLSTSSKISHFSPPLRLDPSLRIVVRDKIPLPPYIELGFDILANTDKLVPNQKTINDVSQYSYMVRFGRPLFGARFMSGNSDVQEDIVHFARRKLQGTTRLITPPIDEAVLVETAINGDLACLAVRLALQFDSRTVEEHEREQKQVANHMRVCLNVSPDFETFVSVAPSEPILAEGARLHMASAGYDLPRKLLKHLQKPGLDKGSRGELVALVLLTLACDKAWERNGSASAYPLLEFFKALFPEEAYTRICKGKPSCARQGENKTFEETFKNSKIYFNHFIKVQDYKVINREYLWKLVARGIAILCFDNQRGIDILIPFLYMDELLRRDNVGVILIQVKNDETYTDRVVKSLFDKIDPFQIRIFDKTEEPVPVIRMVFALASPKSVVTVVNDEGLRRSPRQHESDARFTAFDIWCARTSPKTFSVVKDEQPYQELLVLWKDFPRAYIPWSQVDEASVLRRRMYPGTAAHEDHWTQFCG